MEQAKAHQEHSELLHKHHNTMSCNPQKLFANRGRRFMHLMIICWQEEREASHKEHTGKKAFRAEVVGALKQACSDCSAEHHRSHQSCEHHSTVYFPTICLPSQNATKEIRQKVFRILAAILLEFLQTYKKVHSPLLIPF